jgi:pyrroline-5-carboxylate reductase
LLNSTQNEPLFTRFIACVRSEGSEKKLKERFPRHLDKLSIYRGDNVKAARESDVIILGVDPADVERVLTQHSLREALQDKLLISIAAGWTRHKLEQTIYGSETTANKAGRAWVVRTLPNIAAQVSQSLTAIEVSEPAPPEHYLQITTAIFEKIGRAVQIEPRLMNATTAVGGSTPAFFAVICDALIDAAVAVGVPRDLAHTMIFQSMQGTATMLQSGMHPAVLKDQGTSPEGCTIGGLMVMEEAGVRGHVGRALREAVTLARLMETTEHVNDTRH